jgi:hypothetical protein
MTINERVSLVSDTSYIRSQWVVMSAQLGTSLATSYVWIKCISFGFDTQANSEAYSATLMDRPSSNPTGLVGTLGEYKVVKLTEVKPYSRGGRIDYSPMFPLG